jgi:hypothetical protein
MCRDPLFPERNNNLKLSSKSFLSIINFIFLSLSPAVCVSASVCAKRGARSVCERVCERGCACECGCECACAWRGRRHRGWRRREPGRAGVRGQRRSRPAEWQTSPPHRGPEQVGAPGGAGGQSQSAGGARTRSGDPLELEQELTVSVSRTREGASPARGRGRGGRGAGEGRASPRRLSEWDVGWLRSFASSVENRWVPWRSPRADARGALVILLAVCPRLAAAQWTRGAVSVCVALFAERGGRASQWIWGRGSVGGGSPSTPPAHPTLPPRGTLQACGSLPLASGSAKN